MSKMPYSKKEAKVFAQLQEKLAKARWVASEEGSPDASPEEIREAWRALRKAQKAVSDFIDSHQ